MNGNTDRIEGPKERKKLNKWIILFWGKNYTDTPYVRSNERTLDISPFFFFFNITLISLDLYNHIRTQERSPSKKRNTREVSVNGKYIWCCVVV